MQFCLLLKLLVFVFWGGLHCDENSYVEKTGILHGYQPSIWGEMSMLETDLEILLLIELINS